MARYLPILLTADCTSLITTKRQIQPELNQLTIPLHSNFINLELDLQIEDYNDSCGFDYPISRGPDGVYAITERPVSHSL